MIAVSPRQGTCKYIHGIRSELYPCDNDGVRYLILRYVYFPIESAPVFAANTLQSARLASILDPLLICTSLREGGPAVP